VEERQSDPKPPPRQPNDLNAESEVYEYKSMETPHMNVILESMLAHGNSGKVAARKPKAKKPKKKKTKKNTNKMVKDSKQGKKNPDADEGEGEAAGDQKRPAVHQNIMGNYERANGPTVVHLLLGLGELTDDETDTDKEEKDREKGQVVAESIQVTRPPDMTRFEDMPGSHESDIDWTRIEEEKKALISEFNEGTER
jgi:hypothetical protein